LIREVRQRLESLGRAGLSCIPAAERTAEPARPQPAPSPSPISPVVTQPPAAPPRAPAASPPPTVPVASLFGESGFETPVVPASDRPAILAAAAAEVAVCTR